MQSQIVDERQLCYNCAVYYSRLESTFDEYRLKYDFLWRQQSDQISLLQQHNVHQAEQIKLCMAQVDYYKAEAQEYKNLYFQKNNTSINSKALLNVEEINKTTNIFQTSQKIRWKTRLSNQ